MKKTKKFPQCAWISKKVKDFIIFSKKIQKKSSYRIDFQNQKKYRILFVKI